QTGLTRPWIVAMRTGPGPSDRWRTCQARFPKPGGQPLYTANNDPSAGGYVKARRDHHIVSVAVIVAVGVNTAGRREVLGMTIGHSEAEPFWVEFLRSLARRGLRGVKLV